MEKRILSFNFFGVLKIIGASIVLGWMTHIIAHFAFKIKWESAHLLAHAVREQSMILGLLAFFLTPMTLTIFKSLKTGHLVAGPMLEVKPILGMLIGITTSLCIAAFADAFLMSLSMKWRQDWSVKALEVVTAGIALHYATRALLSNFDGCGLPRRSPKKKVSDNKPATSDAGFSDKPFRLDPGTELRVPTGWR